MKLQKFMQLTKVDVAQNLLYGVFTAEVLDKSGEVADYPTTKAAIELWSSDMEKVSGGKSKGNIRKMHGQEVAGAVREITYDDVKKAVYGCVEVKPEITQEAIKGMLNGFSIGGSYAKRWDDPVHKGATRFTPVISEISVVDNPCVPIAVFDAIKDASFAVLQDGKEVMQKFAPKELEKEQGELPIEEMFKAADGSEHKTRELAGQKNAEIAAAKAAAPALDSLKKLEALAVPEPVKKKLSELIKLEKGMYDVARCAQIISDLDWLHASVASEAAYEEDGSSQPTDLKKIIKTLCAFLKSMVMEETKELVTDKAFDGITEESVGALRKVSGKADLYKDWKPVVPVDQLNKDLTAENAALKKTLEEMPARIEAAIEGVNKRLKHLEEQPAAAGTLFVVEKDKGMDEVTPVVSRTMSPGDFKRTL